MKQIIMRFLERISEKLFSLMCNDEDTELDSE